MNTKFEQLGWVVAAALGAVMISSGFKNQSTTKIGVVDMLKVFRGSDLFKKNQDSFRALDASRRDILTFITQYKVFTPAQTARFKELSMKTNITAPEKAELQKIKDDVMAADKDFKALQTKAAPTADELKKLDDYNAREKSMKETYLRWSNEFQEEVDGQEDTLNGATLDKVKTSITEVGKAQGFTVIFTKDVAPYSANDITDEALKSANKK